MSFVGSCTSAKIHLMKSYYLIMKPNNESDVVFLIKEDKNRLIISASTLIIERNST
jgi:hypothetical protein